MPRAALVRLVILQVFPSWSSTRMARWLGVNARTLQRWLAAGNGEIDESEIPAHLIDKIHAQQHLIEDIDLPGQLDHWIEAQLKAGVDEEVLAAWMADRYQKLIGREID